MRDALLVLPNWYLPGAARAAAMTGAIKSAERKLADRSLRHAGQGLMAWAAGNARVEPKGNAILVTKQASGSAKIDPLMAAFNAIALMARHPMPPPMPGLYVCLD
jgi:phage terminase large subunit-like protein